MPVGARLISQQFPRSLKYHPDWIIAGASGGANALWLTEWLAEALDLRPGMRVLDLGCGRAVSSIFLCREFGVQVWADTLAMSAWRAVEATEAGRSDRGPARAVHEEAITPQRRSGVI